MGYTGAFCYAAALAGLVCPSAAKAQLSEVMSNGKGLLHTCTDRNADDFQLCTAFVSGVLKSAYLVERTESVPRPRFCPTKDAIVLDYINVVTDYLEKHPERLDAPSEALVYGSAALAFPCPPKK